MSDSVSSISKALLPIANALWPKLRRAYKEHQAGRMPFGVTEDLLEKGMEETIKRLVGGKIDDAWWRRTLENIRHKYIAPDFLRIHTIRDWLADTQVQSDFKLLARERIIGSGDLDQNAETRLSQSYSEFTGEIENLAKGPIDVITAIIASGYFGSIIPQLEPIAGMIQNHAQESRKGIQNLDDSLGSMASSIKKLGPDPYTIEAHSRRTEYELDQLLKRRSLDSERTIREIVSLTNRVTLGDLPHTGNSAKAKILYWAARLHASKTETLYPCCSTW